ncbi:MAG TPA: hypothetical protein VKU90_08165 [Caulobacteraceae bacterium]|nr:hypothetical protein [Caulobacteraceae bacterium]
MDRGDIGRALGAVALTALAAGCARPANTASSAPAGPPEAAAAMSIPFVGCASDGQVGPQDPPKGAPITLQIAPSLGKKLAYYVMQNGPGVLAPSGWSCAGIYGSDGATLIVAPQALTPAELMNGNWAGANGDAVSARVATGDTSGRYQVAEVIARVFPANQAFVKGVVANDPSSQANDFPTGAYPTDKLVNKDARTVEFQSPANAVGLGTDPNDNNRLKPGADPVSGVAILTGPTPDLALAAARLPPDLAALAPAIVQRFEADMTAPASASP